MHDSGGAALPILPQPADFAVPLVWGSLSTTSSGRHYPPTSHLRNQEKKEIWKGDLRVKAAKRKKEKVGGELWVWVSQCFYKRLGQYGLSLPQKLTRARLPKFPNTDLDAPTP
ncbi:hypothetical protein PIB30_056071 [Stylosanthes scabra]|uniref:Uncharacterized protein n=1 Tax=Stylosanthes scabra TaxID=79078 RepID=A0ABU6RJK3_9FABA|nr:hypothetical protein [Stylosanthes scabra]